MKIIDRLTSPTPTFFKKLRNIGLVVTGISASIIAAPVALPVVIVSLAGYLATAGSIISVVSQLSKKNENE